MQLYITIGFSLLFVISSFLIYKYIKQKVFNLIVLDKRQQSYISDLLNYNSRLAIQQKLFFCIMLKICSKTKSYGERQLRNHFNIDEDIINDNDKLLNYFIKVNHSKNIYFKIQNCKYTILFEN